jgi:hypothetical protein
MAGIKELLEYETAGDPMSDLKWTRKTTAKIAFELQKLNIRVSPNTVGKLLKDMGFSLRTNQKKISNSSVSPQVRNEQFAYIKETRKRFASRGAMIISVDTKKKELIGCFKNDGKAWSEQPVEVNDHDFRSQAQGIAIPYGIYDLQANRGTVVVGTSFDTPCFATDCLALWYAEEGQKRYPDTTELLILADGGGSNRVGSYVWKYGLQTKLCDRFGLSITVCHYPPGASKWNPIEHRLFCEISKNWAGHPLESYETVLNYIRTTNTKTGLEVTAHLLEGAYEKGVKVSEQQKDALLIALHNVQPKRNYTLYPEQCQLFELGEVSCQRTVNKIATY